MREPAEDWNNGHETSDLPQGNLNDFLEEKVFPAEWKLIPLKDKHPTTKKWQSEVLSQSEVIGKYKSSRFYDGVGVVTGETSGGLIALDIDGPDADARYRRIAGEEYRPRGEERTMAWTSGKPGRRQILWRVPSELIPMLRSVVVLMARTDDTWMPGTIGVKKNPVTGEKLPDIDDPNKPAEELVIRFNKCQSVLPGSMHPGTKKPFRFLSYNGGKPADAPKWIINLLWKHAKPVSWLAQDDVRAIESETAPTLIPPKQIRGWFFREEVQKALYPKLEELVFKHPTFDKYGWVTREGNPPQRMSGCPWHESSSGTSFQYNPENGLWCCHACGVGGDPLDFIHKIETDNVRADRPIGAELERYVEPIANALGFKYPDDLQTPQKVVDTPRLELTSDEFFKRLKIIQNTVHNPAECYDAMANIAIASGRRMSGIQCFEALQEREYYRKAEKSNARSIEELARIDKMGFLIPNLMLRPSQVLLHSAGGLGKTSTAMGLAAAVMYGRSIYIRGIKHKLKRAKVLFIQNDQSEIKFVRDCEDNGIDVGTIGEWLVLKRSFQLNHLHRLREWIIEHRPGLVVIDSIGSASTHMTVQEKDKAFATPFYQISAMNGSYDPKYETDLEKLKQELKREYPPTWADQEQGAELSKEGQNKLNKWIDENDYRVMGFPATSFLHIHHDNAQGEARGTKYLVAAVDEQWHLRIVKDDERPTLQEKGLTPGDCRFIQIKKSRSGREGDRLIVKRDIEGGFSVDDFTPTEKKGDNGQGDPEAATMALKLVKDEITIRRAKKITTDATKRSKTPKDLDTSQYVHEIGMTANDIHEQLNDLLAGQVRDTVTLRTVQRWLRRWNEDGVLIRGRDVFTGAKMNKRSPTYTIPAHDESIEAAPEWEGEEPHTVIEEDEDFNEDSFKN